MDVSKFEGEKNIYYSAIKSLRDKGFIKYTTVIFKVY